MVNQVLIELRDIDNSQIGTLDVVQATDFPLALTERISDINEPTKRLGSYSLNFKIPANDNNNQTLKHLYDINVLDANSLFSKKPITIIINGIEYKNYNFLKIKKSTHKSGDVDEYDCLIFGENRAWAIALQETFLCDIDWAFNNLTTFIYDRANCEDSWARFIVKATRANYDFVMCPINYGGWENKEFVSVNDLRPQFRVLSVIEKGLAAIGYQLNSTFLNSDDFYTKIMTYSWQDDWSLTQAEADAKNFTATSGLGFSAIPNLLNPVITTTSATPDGLGDTDLTTVKSTRIPIQIEISDPNNRWDNTSNSRSNLGLNGYVNFKIDLSEMCVETPHTFLLIITPLGTQKANIITYTTTVKIIVKKFNTTSNVTTEIGVFTEQFLSTVDNSAGSIFQDCEVINDNIIETGLINVNQDEYVFVDMEWTYTTKFSHFINRSFTEAVIRYKDLRIDAEADTKIVEGTTITTKDHMPCDVSVMDVLAGLTAPFNLYFRTDLTTKTVYIEPRDDFYFDNDQSLDWTDKLDVSQNYTVETLSSLPRDWYWRWKDDSKDAHLQWFQEQNNGDHLGQFFLELDDKFDKNKSQFITSSFFGTSYMIQDVPISRDPIVPLYIAALWNELGGEAEYSTDFVPRFLNFRYGIQRVRRTDNRVLQFAAMGWYENGNYIFDIPQGYPSPMFFVSLLPLQGNEPINLYFHDIDTRDSEQGLWDRFWNKTTNVIQSGRVLTGKFLLNDSDMQAVDLRTPIYIDKPEEVAGYYLIDVISNYKPATQTTTKVRLIKRDEITPITPPIGDSISTELPADSHGISIAQGINPKFLIDG